MKVLFLGAPGSGKSTQGKIFADARGYFWLSTGEMLRNSEEQWVHDKLATGELFPDEFVTEMALSEIGKHENVILDGFPRTTKQVEMISEGGVVIEKIVEIDVSPEEITKRMLLRGRSEDTPEVIQKRVQEYLKSRDEIVASLKKYYPEIQYVKVDGEGSPEEIAERVAKNC